MSNIKTIAKNSGWYGLESIISAVVALVTSIAIARTLGPAKNGYIVYVSYIASVVANLGGMGIPATTRKYMAEFIGMGDRGTARYIYVRTLILQTAMATFAAGCILVWVLSDANAEYRWAAVLIVLSIWPSMVNNISAQANVATENLATNLPASLISTAVYFSLIMATVVFQWGVLGIGVALFSMRMADFLIRFFPTLKRILSWETAHVEPEGLSHRMFTFAWQSVLSMLVSLVVWERSEVLLLKSLCPDIRQIAYYSVAFSLAERLLLSSTIFGAGAGATVFAQYGRDKSKLPLITASTFRYLAITAIPLHFIAAALAVPALLLLFGHQYEGAMMAAILAPFLCLPKAFVAPVTSLLQSVERQNFIIAATVVAGIVDLGVAWWLIPAHGAVGACIGSGAGQITAVGGMWAVSIYLYKVKLPWLQVAKITLISILASLTAHFVAVHFSPLWALVWGGSAAMSVLVGLMYVLRVLEPADSARFNTMTRMLPKPLASLAEKFLTILIHSHASNLVSVKESQ